MTFRGGKLPAGLIKNLFENGHLQTPPINIGDFKYIPGLSHPDAWNRVYHNPLTDWTIIAIRGTGGPDMKDVYFDLNLLFEKRNNERFRSAEEVALKTAELYDPQRTSLVGSSLGGAIVQYINENHPGLFYETLTSGKPTTFKEALSKKPMSYNQYDVRTDMDPVSVLKPFRTSSRDRTFKSKTPLDPVKSHIGPVVFSELYYPDQNELVGKGITSFQSMTVPALKTFIKDERRRKKVFGTKYNISLKKKNELVRIAEELYNLIN